MPRIAMMGQTFVKDSEDTHRIWIFPFATLVPSIPPRAQGTCSRRGATQLAMDGRCHRENGTIANYTGSGPQSRLLISNSVTERDILTDSGDPAKKAAPI